MKKLICSFLILVLVFSLGTAVSEGDSSISSLEYTLSSSGDYYTVSGIGSFTASSLLLPSEYNGKPVLAVGTRAFENCNNLTYVSFPSCITEIEKFAFSGCKNLKTVELSAGLTYLGMGAFYKCVSLQNISIPASVSYIGDWAFYNCAMLTEIAIPGSEPELGIGVFNACSRLSSVTLGNVSSVSQYCFADCIQLKEISFSSMLRNVDEYAFADCFNLKSIYFCSANVLIDGYAFYNVSADVVYPENDDAWDDFYFADYGGDLAWHSGKIAYLKGDVNASGIVDSDDAIYLLAYSLYPEQYKINQPADFNGSGQVDSDDAIYLLGYSLYPDKYPLH